MGNFKDKLVQGDEFVITCEFVPGRGSEGAAIEEVIEFGKKVVGSTLPVHAVSITDHPGGNPAIAPDVLATQLKALGMESLVHFSCASVNRNMMEARASAMARSGLNNVLVVSGDYPVGGFEGMARPVFDLDSVQALTLLTAMNNGIEVPGKKKDAPGRLPKTNFFLAAGVSPFKYTEAEQAMQYAKLEKKIRAGAALIISQLGYDIEKFAEILKYLRMRNLRIPVLGNCYLLSKAAARFMNKGEVPGCTVPDELLKRIEAEAESTDKGRKARMERAAQLTAMFRGLKFAGVHIGGFGLKFEDIEYIVNRSAEIAPNWRDFVPAFRFRKKGDFFMFSEDKELNFEPGTLVPVATPRRRVYSANFEMSKLFHRFVFTQGTLGFAAGKMFYGVLEKWRFGSRVAYLFERVIKEILFDCQECGDCALFEICYLCPMSRCAKSQRNGPCGGSCKTKCEADKAKTCLWVLAYDRFSARGKLDEFRDQFVPPVNYALSRTSSWSNFFLGKDHAAKKIPGIVVTGTRAAH